MFWIATEPLRKPMDCARPAVSRLETKVSCAATTVVPVNSTVALSLSSIPAPCAEVRKEFCAFSVLPKMTSAAAEFAP